MTTSNTAVATRPGVVTFVGVVLYIKAALAAVVALALVIERNNDELLSVMGQTSDTIWYAAIGEVIAAVLLFLVASAVMSGAKWSRVVVAIVLGLRLAFATYWMIAHIGGGLQWNAILSAGIAIFVLWALYGNKDSEKYFEGAL
jgi:hypothetical protein